MQGANVMDKHEGEPLLHCRSVNTHYGPIHILQELNLTIYAGELVCLLGGNASGKSTTLKMLLGLVKLSSGAVEFDGEVVCLKRLF
jgi:branched-chain amino acid transport system ATP-binding protein